MWGCCQNQPVRHEAATDRSRLSRFCSRHHTFGMFETMLSGAMDEFPTLLRNKKLFVTAVACSFEFLLGLPCITSGGIYVLQIMDWYCASFSLMLISLTECLVIAWVYGTDRFVKDIELMIGYKPPRYWVYSWKYITPAVIIFIWLFSVSTLGPVTYGTYEYPNWAILFGWFLGICSIVPIPLCMVIQVYKEEGPIVERFKRLMKPAANWGPAQPEDRKRYLLSLGITDLETVETFIDNKSEMEGTEMVETETQLPVKV